MSEKLDRGTYVPLLERRPRQTMPPVHGWSSGRLAEAQERATKHPRTDSPLLFRLYTEDRPNLADLVSRYFAGATILHAVGIWYRQTEESVVIEIIGHAADGPSVLRLHDDIRSINQQDCVIVTVQSVTRFDPLGSDGRL